MDHLRLTGIEASGYHGITAEERRRAQDFLVDVDIETDLSLPGLSDDFGCAVDAGQIVNSVATVVQNSECVLIEALAEQIAESVLLHPHISGVTVTVHKPFPFVNVRCKEISATISRGSRPHSKKVQKKSSLHEVTTEDAFPAVIGLVSPLREGTSEMLAFIADLDSAPGTSVTGISPLYETTIWNEETMEPSFLYSAVILLKTKKDVASLRTLLSICQAAQAHISSFLLNFDDIVDDSSEPRLPLPTVWNNPIFLSPWDAVDSEAFIPGPSGGTVGDLLHACPDRDTTHKVSDLWVLGESG